jgi:outer membrane immunogenic protein
MKFLLRTACLVALAASPAIAADMPLKAPPMVAPVYSWTGFYIGVNAGAALETFDPTTSTIFSRTGYFANSSVPAIGGAGVQTTESTAFIWGGQAGYNWQTGNAVYGFEVDFDSLHHSATTSTGAVYPCCAPTAFTITSTSNADWLLTLRPRVGMAVNSWLFYVTGGAAAAKINSTFVFSDTFATAAESASISGTKWGWVAGFGGETAFGGGWSFKGEFLYASIASGISGSSTNLTAFTPPIAFPTNVFTHRLGFQTAIARVGLNYRFGGMY